VTNLARHIGVGAFTSGFNPVVTVHFPDVSTGTVSASHVTSKAKQKPNGKLGRKARARESRQHRAK